MNESVSKVSGEVDVMRFIKKYDKLPSDFYEEKHEKPFLNTWSGNTGVLVQIEVETLKRLIKMRDVKL